MGSEMCIRDRFYTHYNAMPSYIRDMLCQERRRHVVAAPQSLSIQGHLAYYSKSNHSCTDLHYTEVIFSISLEVGTHQTRC